MPRPRVYLAGPDVFLPAPESRASELKDVCARAGLEGQFPLDAGLDLSDIPLPQAGLRISRANEDLIRRSEGVLANLTPFRGPSADVGTVYEVGFARALGLPVVGYTFDEDLFADRTRRWLSELGKPARPREDGSCEDVDGFAIEDFRLPDNLMVPGGILAGGGAVVGPARAAREGHSPELAAALLLSRLLGAS